MYANLTNDPVQVITGKSSVVIKLQLDTKEGGATLDTTGFTPTSIEAGHPIIKETATGKYKPMPVNAGATAYQALPAGHTYYGILNATIATNRPFAGILLRGVVNPNACPFDFSTILAAITTALPLIAFRAD